MRTSFFGVQLALDLPPQQRLRNLLAARPAAHRRATGLAGQRGAWAETGELLRQATSQAVLGTWDLLRDGSDAEYADWTQGLEAMADWDAADFGGGTLLLASLVFLVRRGSNADLTLGDACDLPRARWHVRATYHRLIALPGQLTFTGVLGCALYIAPNPATPDIPGFSLDVLHGEGFDYLEKVG